MKIEIQLERNDILISILSQVAGIIGRSDKEIYQHIHCDVKDNVIYFTAVNDSMQMSASVGLVKATSDCTFTLPAKRFLDMVRMGQNNEIKLTLEDGIVKIRCGRNNSTLLSLDPESYPTFFFQESQTKITLPAQVLLNAIQASDFAMAKNDARYFLNGLKMEFNGDNQSLNTIATDGHRLAFRNTKLMKDENVSEFESLGIIVPVMAINKIKTLLKTEKGNVTLTIGQGGNSMLFAFAEYNLYLKLIDGKFPDYRRVIPRASETEFALNREELKNMLQRIKVFSTQEFSAARFTFNDNELTVKSINHKSVDSSEETMSIEAKSEMKNIEVGINLDYMLDIANNAAGDNLLFKITSPSSAILIIPEIEELSETKYVVMPMRI